MIIPLDPVAAVALLVVLDLTGCSATATQDAGPSAKTEVDVTQDGAPAGEAFRRGVLTTAAQSKRHNQVLIALARRRCDVPFAMLRDGTLYQADYDQADYAVAA